jgi:hypothetical protein
MLLSHVANCLSVSPMLAWQKFKQDLGELSATAAAEVGRVDNTRLWGTRIQWSIPMQVGVSDSIGAVLKG